MFRHPSGSAPPQHAEISICCRPSARSAQADSSPSGGNVSAHHFRWLLAGPIHMARGGQLLRHPSSRRAANTGVRGPILPANTLRHLGPSGPEQLSPLGGPVSSGRIPSATRFLKLPARQKSWLLARAVIAAGGDCLLIRSASRFRRKRCADGPQSPLIPSVRRD